MLVQMTSNFKQRVRRELVIVIQHRNELTPRELERRIACG